MLKFNDVSITKAYFFYLSQLEDYSFDGIDENLFQQYLRDPKQPQDYDTTANILQNVKTILMISKNFWTVLLRDNEYTFPEVELPQEIVQLMHEIKEARIDYRDLMIRHCVSPVYTAGGRQTIKEAYDETKDPIILLRTLGLPIPRYPKQLFVMFLKIFGLSFTLRLFRRDKKEMTRANSSWPRINLFKALYATSRMKSSADYNNLTTVLDGVEIDLWFTNWVMFTLGQDWTGEFNIKKLTLIYGAMCLFPVSSIKNIFNATATDHAMGGGEPEISVQGRVDLPAMCHLFKLDDMNTNSINVMENEKLCISLLHLRSTSSINYYFVSNELKTACKNQTLSKGEEYGGITRENVDMIATIITMIEQKLFWLDDCGRIIIPKEPQYRIPAKKRADWLKTYIKLYAVHPFWAFATTNVVIPVLNDDFVLQAEELSTPLTPNNVLLGGGGKANQRFMMTIGQA